jgi:hypothetical protein
VLVTLLLGLVEVVGDVDGFEYWSDTFRRCAASVVIVYLLVCSVVIHLKIRALPYQFLQKVAPSDTIAHALTFVEEINMQANEVNSGKYEKVEKLISRVGTKNSWITTCWDELRTEEIGFGWMLALTEEREAQIGFRTKPTGNSKDEGAKENVACTESAGCPLLDLKDILCTQPAGSVISRDPNTSRKNNFSYMKFVYGDHTRSPLDPEEQKECFANQIG